MPVTTPSSKRKLLFGGFQRRVRARKEEPDPEPEEFSNTSPKHNVVDDSDTGDRDQESQASESESASARGDTAEENEEENEDANNDKSSLLPKAQLSFRTLAKAQASMPSIQLREGRRVTKNDDKTRNSEKEDDRRHPSELPTRRSSKHAPMEMSSKKQVSRKREVISFEKVAARDPRFSAASGAVDEARARKAYAFLDEYRDAELAQLKAAIKKTKSAEEKGELSRSLKSMQGRREAQAKRDAERELIAHHRRQEKELVAQGKKPFYLKKGEQKRQLLLDRFAGMKKKQIDRTIERRRKKLTARERKTMPISRRGAM
ncbi:hypothetical protein GGS21DRAFT_343407 [Xylaria nigripes]|nr:hypothetical protein GGS21DRAFT_343407 [Xylaria nigripes]